MSKFRFRYYYGEGVKTYGKSVYSEIKDVEAANPVSALNQFHMLMQHVQEMDSDRHTVIRPRLKHDAYKVESVHQVYHDRAFRRDITSTPIVESLVDLPGSPNPDLSDVNRGGRDAFNPIGDKNAEFNFGANP